MSNIEFVIGREVLDSRGNPTVEVMLDRGQRTRIVRRAVDGTVPAVDLRDGITVTGARACMALRQRTVKSPTHEGLDALEHAPSPHPLRSRWHRQQARVQFDFWVRPGDRKGGGDELDLPPTLCGRVDANVLPVPLEWLNGGAHADNT